MFEELENRSIAFYEFNGHITLRAIVLAQIAVTDYRCNVCLIIIDP